VHLSVYCYCYQCKIRLYCLFLHTIFPLVCDECMKCCSVCLNINSCFLHVKLSSWIQCNVLPVHNIPCVLLCFNSAQNWNAS
jgi:hypothetical protein